MKGKGLICSRKTRRGCLIFLPFQAPFVQISPQERKLRGKEKGKKGYLKLQGTFPKLKAVMGKKR